MTRLRIVAFTGPKTCGKDTAAKALTDLNKEGYLFRRAPMAQGVKNIVSEVFGWGPELFEDPELKEKKLDVWPFIEPRWPLMDIANFMRDKYGGHVWPKWWERQALACQYTWAAHVITDLRFPEELEMLQRHQSLVIYVERAEAEQALADKQRAGDAMALNPSEAHYPLMYKTANAVADNNGSIGHLNGQVQAIVRNAWGYWRDWKVA